MVSTHVCVFHPVADTDNIGHSSENCRYLSPVTSLATAGGGPLKMRPPVDYRVISHGDSEPIRGWS